MPLPFLAAVVTVVTPEPVGVLAVWVVLAPMVLVVDLLTFLP
jgi:hypothetical protein